MSQQFFQRQQPGIAVQYPEITQRQVWALAAGYVLYFVLSITALIWYNRYVEGRDRRR